MFTREEAQFQVFQQSAIATEPGVPNGLLIPRDGSFKLQKDRNLIDNPAIFNDGFERQPALGNHKSTADGNFVPNLSFIGHPMKHLCRTLTEDGIVGPITITNPGSAYATPPVVGFTGGGGGTGFTATSTVSGGLITGVTITNPGTGFTAAPVITFTGGGGTLGAATAVLQFSHVGKLVRGPVLYNEFEKGIIGSTLWYRYLDMVMNKFTMSIPVEGIMTIGVGYAGSGKRIIAATSLDTTPTELTGPSLEYADMAILENAVDIGQIVQLDIDVERKVVEKRVSGGGGLATEMRYGGSKVSGKVKIFFESGALLAKAEAKTLTSFKATIAPTQVTDSLEVLLSEVRLGIADWTAEGEDGIMAEFPFRSIVSALATSPFQITVKNQVAIGGYV